MQDGRTGEGRKEGEEGLKNIERKGGGWFEERKKRVCGMKEGEFGEGRRGGFREGRRGELEEDGRGGSEEGKKKGETGEGRRGGL